MHPQMQAHQAKAPVRGQHVECPGKAPSALDGKKIKHMPGKNYAADHQAQHTQQKGSIYKSAEQPSCGPLSLCQATIPTPVQGMMPKE